MGIQQNMKLSLLATIAAANGQLEPSFEDYWPANIDNHHRMLQTTAEHPEPTELNFSGRIPQWMSGSFYKNGPGIYEWGEMAPKGESLCDVGPSSGKLHSELLHGLWMFSSCFWSPHTSSGITPFLQGHDVATIPKNHLTASQTAQ